MSSSKKTSPKSFEVSHLDAFKIAIPMTLAYLTTPLLGIVDTAVVGRLNDAALIGGLAVGAIIFDLIFTSFNFLRSGTTGLTAQALGRHDDEEIQAAFLRAMIVAIGFGLVVCLSIPLLLALGLYFMAPSEGVAAATTLYLKIRGLSAIFALGNYVILGWFLGLGRASSGLVLQILLNGINILGSIFLALHLGWGIEGVAWATVFSEFIAFVIGTIWVAKIMKFKLLVRAGLIFDFAQIKHMMSVNFDIMVRSFSLLFAFAFFTRVGARYGDVTLAANAILLHLFFVGGYFLDGFATAAEQLAGRAVGAKYRPAFDSAVKITLQWGLVLAIFLFAIYWLFGDLFISIMTTEVLVQLEAKHYLIWAAFTVLTGVLAFQMDGIFIGATWTSDMRNMMILSLIFYLLAWGISAPFLGNHGLWLALNVFLLARGLSLWLRLPIRAKETFL